MNDPLHENSHDKVADGRKLCNLFEQRRRQRDVIRVRRRRRFLPPGGGMLPNFPRTDFSRPARLRTVSGWSSRRFHGAQTSIGMREFIGRIGHRSSVVLQQSFRICVSSRVTHVQITQTTRSISAVLMSSSTTTLLAKLAVAEPATAYSRDRKEGG
jgi:hypothetical protein